MIEKIKGFIKEHKSEICLGSLGIIGYLILDNKIKQNYIKQVSDHTRNQSYIHDTLKLLSNTQDHMIEMLEEESE